MTEMSLLCPYCGRWNTEPGPIDPGATPKEDDIAFCWLCKQVAVVHNNRLCIPTAYERAEIEADDRVHEVRAALELYAGPSEVIAAVRRRAKPDDA